METIAKTKYLSKKEVADILQVSIQTVNRLMKEGKISYLKLRRRVYFTEDQLNRDIEKLWKK